MAEGDIIVMNNTKESLWLKLWDFDTDTFKLALLTSWAQTPDGNLGYASVSGTEVVTTNYVAGGQALTLLTVTQDDTNDRGKWDAADVTWSSLGTTTIADGVLYNDTITTPVADPLVAHLEIATNSNGNNYTVSWHADGIIYIA